jgi:hypothetical protein
MYRLGHCRHRGRGGAVALCQCTLLFSDALLKRGEALLGSRCVGRGEGEMARGAVVIVVGGGIDKARLGVGVVLRSRFLGRRLLSIAGATGGVG